MLDFIVGNKEWIFSGIGVATLVAIVRLVWRRKGQSTIEQSQKAARQATAYQAGRDIIIAPAPTPVPAPAPRAQTLEEMHHQYNVYWRQTGQGTGEGPFCPKCRDGERREARMSDQPHDDFWRCPVCDYVVEKPGRGPRQTRAVTDFDPFGGFLPHLTPQRRPPRAIRWPSRFFRGIFCNRESRRGPRVRSGAPRPPG